MAIPQEYLDNFIKPEESTAEEALAYIFRVCQELNFPFIFQFDPAQYPEPTAGNPTQIVKPEEFKVSIDSKVLLNEDGTEMSYPDFETLVVSGLSLLRLILEELKDKETLTS